MIRDTMLLGDQWWKASDILEHYILEHLATMTREEFEAHKLGVEIIRDAALHRDIQRSLDRDNKPSAKTTDDSWDNPEWECNKRRHEKETALDEYETSKLWAKSEPRYYVHLIIDKIGGYPDVEVDLFHARDSMPLDELSRLVVLRPGRIITDITKWYTGSAFEQTFSKAEVQQLYAYFKADTQVRRIEVKRAKAPDNNSVGWGDWPIGSGQAFHIYYKDEGYSLPFKVEGYFDIRPRWEEEMKAKKAKENDAGCTGDLQPKVKGFLEGLQ